MGHGDVTVATCQFPVSADVEVNLGHVLKQACSAKRRGAAVAHFPEGSLSSYAGSDLDTFGGFDWEGPTGRHRTGPRGGSRPGHVSVLGSTHRLSQGHKPHNSLYIIDNTGEIVDRYDKRFCSGIPRGDLHARPLQPGRPSQRLEDQRGPLRRPHLLRVPVP